MAEVWAAAAVVVGAGITAYGASQDAKSATKAGQKENEKNFQRDKFLAEQGRKWALEDRKRGEKRVANFRGFAPESAGNFNGQDVIAPDETSTSGLADFDPSTGLRLNPGVVIDPNKNVKPKTPLMTGG